MKLGSGLDRTRTGGVAICSSFSLMLVNWRATADEDGHYCFAVAL